MMTELKKTGTLYESLTRSNPEVKEHRAKQLHKHLKTNYKRYIEDAVAHIENLEIELEDMLDMSPNSADSLLAAKNVDSKGWVEKYVKKVTDIKKYQLSLDEIKNRYLVLFGDD